MHETALYPLFKSQLMLFSVDEWPVHIVRLPSSYFQWAKTLCFVAFDMKQSLRFQILSKIRAINTILVLFNVAW